MSWEGIAENIISDFAFLIIIISIGWGIFALTKRKKLLKFFGISESRRLTIYLSDLQLKQGNATGIDNKTHSFIGSAVSYWEMQSATKFRDLFYYFLPSLSETPDFLSKLLIADIQIQLHLSPANESETERLASFITLGSPAYNLASKFAESELHSRAHFSLGHLVLFNPEETTNSTGIIGLVESNKPKHIVSGAVVQEDDFGNLSLPKDNLTSINVNGVPPLTDSTYGFVERIIDHQNKRAIFYIAGLSELSTVGAGNFLISNWEKLQQKHGDDDNFLVMLKFEPNDYKRWIVIF